MNIPFALSVNLDAIQSRLAETTVLGILAVVVLVLLFGAIVYAFIDYRHHRKPLAQADVGAALPYTFSHHIRVVTIPLLRYRLSISIKKKPSNITRF